MKIGPNGELLDDEGNPITTPVGGVDPTRIASALQARRGAAPTPTAGPDPELAAYRRLQEQQRQSMTHGAAPPPPPGLAGMLDSPRPTPPPAPAVPAPATPTVTPPAMRRMERTGSQTTTRRTEISPEHAANLQAQDDNFQAQIEARQEEGERKKQLADLDALAARGIADNEALRALEQTQAIQQGEEEAKKRRAGIDAQVDKMSKMKPVEYGASMSSQKKALAFIGLALSGIGDVFSNLGGQRGTAVDRALNLIQSDRDRHDQAEREKLLNEQKKLDRMDKLDTTAKADFLERLRMIDVRRAGTDAWIKSQLVAAKKARGQTDEEIATSKDILLLEQSQLQHQERAKALSDREVVSTITSQLVESTGAGVGPGGKPPTEGQGKANQYLTVMVDEAKRIEALPPLSDRARQVLFEELALRNAAEKNPGMDLAARMTGIRQTVEQQLKGSDRQAYAAYLSYLDPLVRARTGANAPASEVAALAAPIMPARGDQAADLTAKKDRRKNLMYSIAESSNDPASWRARIDQVYQGGGAAPAAGGNQDPRVQRMVELVRSQPNHPQAEAIKNKLREMGVAF